LLPPPAPFKVFVFAAGALGMPVSTFIAALTVARALRFCGEGYLAVRYGVQAYAYLSTHKLQFAGASIAVAIAAYLLGAWVSRRAQRES
jgi:membrane protein DedA with SNARE-associated domain